MVVIDKNFTPRVTALIKATILNILYTFVILSWMTKSSGNVDISALDLVRVPVSVGDVDSVDLHLVAEPVILHANGCHFIFTSHGNLWFIWIDICIICTVEATIHQIFSEERLMLKIVVQVVTST